MADYILRMNHITKEFYGVKALDDVNIKVKRGEIHALCGENGAGKSTLMNVLSGVNPYGTYSGDIVYHGAVCQFHNIKQSEAKGIVIIHQELALSPICQWRRMFSWEMSRQEKKESLTGPKPISGHRRCWQRWDLRMKT